MPNTYFRFKQFTIWQDQCAMKVSTLACILGAYADHEHPRRILDIGAGTGLLTLMMAQRFPRAEIHSIEIEELAYRQAMANIQASPWPERIHLIHGNALEFNDTHFDLIISNPPFFENHLLSDNEKINLAKHCHQLTFGQLTEKISRLLSEDGLTHILLPPFEMKKWEKLALASGLHLLRKLQIINFPGQEAKASVGSFSKQPAEPVEEQLVIRKKDNTYTNDFTRLLKAFYLHF